jgi:hypothetical protein
MLNVTLKTKAGANARGVFDPSTEEITIMKGSILTIDPYAKGIATNIKHNYKTAVTAHKSGVLKEMEKGIYKVVKDMPGLSVSGASVIVTGKAGSGWNKWRLAEDGRPLDIWRSSGDEINEPTQNNSTAPTTPPPGGQNPPPPPMPPPQLPANPNCQDLLEALVKWIHHDPYPRIYPHAPNEIPNCVPVPPVTGWDKRIRYYAYAKWRHATTFEHVYYFLNPIILSLHHLCVPIHWHGVHNRGSMPAGVADELEMHAMTIHMWGGLGISHRADTWAVAKSAILGAQYHGAPMSSGWTKYASLITDGLPNSQTIWDSRVSTSVIWRIDQILHANALNRDDFQPCLANLRIVNGRGGTRPRPLNAHWLAGACDWPAHFAGSAIVREMVKILNDPANGYPRMPQPNGLPAKDWDVFGVGLVLFMDGY